MGTQSNSVMSNDKKNMIFVVILAIAIIISILFWKTESAGEKLEKAQFKLYGLRDDVNDKIIKLDSLHAENKLLNEQYTSLKQNYLKLQKIIVAKKKDLRNISNVSNRKEMAGLLDEMNSHLLNYETISEDLEDNTKNAVNKSSDSEILAENKRIAEELRIAELNTKILRKEKVILSDRVKELETKLASYSTTAEQNNSYLEELQQKFDKEQERFTKLKAESDDILRKQQLTADKLDKTTEVIEDIAENSFKAIYYFREGRKAQRTVLLNKTDLHRRRFVKSLDITFVIPDKKNEKEAKLSVLKRDETGNFSTYRYDNISVPINDLKGDVSLNVNPKFDKGEYKFVVKYESEQLYNHEFVIQ